LSRLASHALARGPRRPFRRAEEDGAVSGWMQLNMTEVTAMSRDIYQLHMTIF
jgi:hypothetical protein